MKEKILENKCALVTGSSKGIGAEMARGLAREGAHVVVNYKTDRDGADATCKSILDQGGQAVSIQGDVSSAVGAKNLITKVCDQLGRVDILVNNAARTRFGPPLEATDEDFDDVINTNNRGTFFASIESAKRMMEQGNGSIINVTTCSVKLQIEWHAVYTMSKGGGESLTEALAVELAPNVRVNAIAPGPTKVARSLTYNPNVEETWAPKIPLGRMCLPEDYVGPLIFLASDQSAFLTGEILHVDGGWSLQGNAPPMSDLDLSEEKARG